MISKMHIPEAMNDQDKLRDLIHRERRVELAFEASTSMTVVAG